MDSGAGRKSWSMGGGTDRDYGHGNYGRNMDGYSMESGNDRYGPYESFDSRSSVGGRDLYRSGYGYNESDQGYGDSYDARYDNPYRNSVDSFESGSSWDPTFTRAKVRTGFMEDRGRESYSSYGGFSSPYMKPATVGSRGRGMPAYTDGGFGGPAAGRGRGRGGLGRGMRRPTMMDYAPQLMSGGMARGIKRKMAQPFRAPMGFGKKPKLTPGGNQNAKPTSAPAEPLDPEEEEKRRTEARREKQRRRREKNSENMAFTCSFCKFRSFDEKGIEDHLISDAHQEMLDHIQKQTKFDKPVMEFLHECIVNKYKKTAARKTQAAQIQSQNQAQNQTPNQTDAPKPTEKDIMEGVTPDDHMMKVETVHCSACSAYVPALHSSVQVHLKSADHSKNKLAYKDQIKRESILTATSILNNPLVKARYELYLKGENPFEPHTEESAAEAAVVEEPGAAVEAENTEEAVENEGEDFTADPLTATDDN
ncbi:DBIRD complex subunit ZNF326 isoform X2 [Hyperolius riggenbachi]|uniref:DBIRD complex subunit ZNF326 isoform X2 n=1 Tax=Hyperolius riggenbachi TaxID=752182 RepID=UPI0035A33A5E